jgi:hypothetical protein
MACELVHRLVDYVACELVHRLVFQKPEKKNKILPEIGRFIS